MASGGKRKNAGRKKGQVSNKLLQRNRTIRLDDITYKRFLALGGANWLRAEISNSWQKYSKCITEV